MHETHRPAEHDSDGDTEDATSHLRRTGQDFESEMGRRREEHREDLAGETVKGAGEETKQIAALRRSLRGEKLPAVEKPNSEFVHTLIVGHDAYEQNVLRIKFAREGLGKKRHTPIRTAENMREAMRDCREGWMPDLIVLNNEFPLGVGFGNGPVEKSAPELFLQELGKFCEENPTLRRPLVLMYAHGVQDPNDFPVDNPKKNPEWCREYEKLQKSAASTGIRLVSAIDRNSDPDELRKRLGTYLSFPERE